MGNEQFKELCSSCGQPKIACKCRSSEDSPEAIDGMLQKLDRDLLKTLTKTANEPGALLVREVKLDQEVRDQVILACKIIQASLESQKDSDEWRELTRLHKEIGDTGVLMSFKFPPEWLVNAGANASVEATQLSDGRSGIQVSDSIYNLYYWNAKTEMMMKDMRMSDDLLDGRSASFLGQDLKQLSHFLKQTGLLESKK